MSGAVDLSRLVEKANGNIDAAVRQTLILAAQGVIHNSPVGNPDNWLSLNPYTDLKTGKRKTMKKAPPGYVGGRLRGSWGFGVSYPANGPTDSPDKSGTMTLSRITQAIRAQEAGPKFYITTALPYARRIEYEGWSHTQSPQGMVRITIANLPNAIREYVRGLK